MLHAWECSRAMLWDRLKSISDRLWFEHTWNWSIAMKSRASTASYVDRISRTAKFRTSCFLQAGSTQVPQWPRLAVE